MKAHPSRQFLWAQSAVICLCLVSVLSAAVSAEIVAPIRVLLLSGQNNHDWQSTTPKIRSLLVATGRFRVDIEEHPERLAADKLESYDVIVSNWNSWDHRDDKDAAWPESLKKAYVGFVRGGKGHVVVHAGSSSFPDWDEYLEIALATWKLGQTGHGPRHEFAVRMVDAEHPVTRGLKDFKIHAELWNRPGLQSDVTVLASALSAKQYGGSDQDEPIAMAKELGKGRSFTLMLGHSVDEMESPGFVALLLRGTEWAATGKVTSSAAE